MEEWRVIITCVGSTLGECFTCGLAVAQKLTLYCSFFYRHPLLLKYEWYWRLEPEIKYFCDIT